MKGTTDLSWYIIAFILVGLISATSFLIIDTWVFYKISFEEKMYCMHEPDIEIAKMEFYLAVYSLVVVGFFMLYFAKCVAEDIREARNKV